MKTILTFSLALTVSAGLAQTKPDTVRYTLTEQQITQIYDLLAFGDQAAGNSTTVSTNQWKQYHEAVMKIDSFIKVEYVKRHPVKETNKKPQK